MGNKIPSMIVEGGINSLINKYSASRNLGFTDRTMAYVNSFTGGQSNNWRGPMITANHGFKGVIAASNYLQQNAPPVTASVSSFTG